MKFCPFPALQIFGSIFICILLILIISSVLMVSVFIKYYCIKYLQGGSSSDANENRYNTLDFFPLLTLLPLKINLRP